VNFLLLGDFKGKDEDKIMDQETHLMFKVRSREVMYVGSLEECMREANLIDEFSVSEHDYCAIECISAVDTTTMYDPRGLLGD